MQLQQVSDKGVANRDGVKRAGFFLESSCTTLARADHVLHSPRAGKFKLSQEIKVFLSPGSLLFRTRSYEFLCQRSPSLASGVSCLLIY